MVLRVIPGRIVPLFRDGVEITLPFAMKILLADASSMKLLFAESKNRTSLNPLFFAFICAFRTYIKI